MIAHVRANLILVLLTILICAVLYPLGILVIGQRVFPSSANGSLITSKDGTVVGSHLIGQSFSKNQYFWPRPSAAGNGYAANASGGSNWGPSNPKLRGRVAQQLGAIVRYRGGQPVGNDIEAWFQAGGANIQKNRPKRDLVAEWFGKNPTLARVWAKSSPIIEEYVRTFPGVEEMWQDAHDSTSYDPENAKTEDLVIDYFAKLFVAAHSGKWPCKGVETKDGNPSDVVRPLDRGESIESSDIASIFFDMWLSDNPWMLPRIEPVATDLVTASGSGLDPYITERSVRYQLDRVVGARAKKADQDVSIVRSRVNEAVRDLAFTPLGGFDVEPIVNVLELNLELDRQIPLPLAVEKP